VEISRKTVPAGHRDQSAAALPICGLVVTVTRFFFPPFVLTILVVFVGFRENFSSPALE
jgi:hypothetical protein